VSDADALCDAWEAAGLGRSITHLEHVRIAWVLVRRHGREEGGRRILAGTLRNCEALGVADRFDEPLTRRWIEAIADAVDEDAGGDVDGFLRAHPELARSDLLGSPTWKRPAQETRAKDTLS
jgi:hypothetical protein